MIYTQLSSLIRNLGDTFPIFFFRLLYHILCIIWRAPPILWLIPYIKHLNFITRLLPPTIFTVAASQSSVCLDIHLYPPSTPTSSGDRVSSRDDLYRPCFAPITSFRASILLLKRVVNFLVLNITSSKEPKSFAAKPARTSKPRLAQPTACK